MQSLIFLILFLLFIRNIRAEIFSCMTEVEKILNAEQDAAASILRYIQREQQKLEGLKRYSRDIHTSQERLKPGIAPLTDPLNGFLVIKHLEDLSIIRKIIKHNNAEHFIKNITKQREFAGVSFPDMQDYEGAATALYRLQDTYQLKTKDIADGKIPGVFNGEKLSAYNCFEIGRVAYLKHPPDYYHTLLWMQEAHDRLKTELHPTIKETLILEHLSYAMYHQENIERAWFLAKQVKKIDPKSTTIDDNLEFYELELAAIRKNPKNVNERTLPPLNLNRPPPENTIENFEMYEKLCRGEVKMSESRQAKLYSYYKRNRPFLKLAPLKTEIIHLKPKIVIYREAVSENESTKLKELAMPRLNRAKVQNRQGQDEFANYRVSKSAWLNSKVDPIVRKIGKRIEDMTDLSIKTGEELQLANYGLGGHYEPHFDFAEKDEIDSFKDLASGNRIATAMFYLSQPFAGGYTVFPELKLAIPPTKNDCVMWYNLYKNGEGDEMLRHAACPVLAGNKWVANEWLHEYDNEFMRPCSLDKNEYE